MALFTLIISVAVTLLTFGNVLQQVIWLGADSTGVESCVSLWNEMQLALDRP